MECLPITRIIVVRNGHLSALRANWLISMPNKLCFARRNLTICGGQIAVGGYLCKTRIA